ncbi:hypothetical protein F2Q69_00059072 [Brassica cretica]|uniref:Uncharacterized protein n=1 Tax=Brassica cretica TaxID=69181 RepID=A0A8S9RB90_BRACR|nr:hypothetical protein F2Q69_00059072 [Brassica cretica]
MIWLWYMAADIEEQMRMHRFGSYPLIHVRDNAVATLYLGGIDHRMQGLSNKYLDLQCAMVSSSDVREPLLLRKFPSKDCLKGMRVWRPLSWVFLRAMDSGIASLSGAVAWASDSESLFVEPSGVL